MFIQDGFLFSLNLFFAGLEKWWDGIIISIKN